MCLSAISVNTPVCGVQDILYNGVGQVDDEDDSPVIQLIFLSHYDNCVLFYWERLAATASSRIRT